MNDSKIKDTMKMYADIKHAFVQCEKIHYFWQEKEDTI